MGRRDKRQIIQGAFKGLYRAVSCLAIRKPSQNLSALLVAGLFFIPTYERREFYHWIDSDRDCKNTRHELLEKESLMPVRYSKSGCKVVSGLRKDVYSGVYETSATKVDIDHIISLREAWYGGAYKWTSSQRRAFANDYLNLAVT